jgi:hypothetical protein
VSRGRASRCTAIVVPSLAVSSVDRLRRECGNHEATGPDPIMGVGAAAGVQILTRGPSQCAQR